MKGPGHPGSPSSCTIHLVRGPGQLLPLLPSSVSHVQRREAGDRSQNASLLPGFGTAARRGLEALLQHTRTHTNQSVIGML